MHHTPSGQINQQLALAIQLNHEATFADFCWGDNTLLHQTLQTTLRSTGERLIYLWSEPGCGKSHLLQACCHGMSDAQTAVYLPLRTLKKWGPQVLEGMEEQSLIALDDVDAIANDTAWEEALFHLYNHIRENEHSIFIISGPCPPSHLPLKLADLRSRLQWGLVIQLHDLHDEEKIHTLQLHARKRGLELPHGVGQFLLTRCSRNMHDLHNLLNQLDEASLIAQRRITIPFVKHILGL